MPQKTLGNKAMSQTSKQVYNTMLLWKTIWKPVGSLNFKYLYVHRQHMGWDQIIEAVHKKK